MSRQRTAFVTGASGFVGGALVNALVADGWAVRALARSSAAAAKVADAGAEPVGGDLGDRTAISHGASDCDVAFHAAALAGEWGKRRDFEVANVEGTANVLTACAAAGVQRFVHVGTEAALMRRRALVDVDEKAPLQPGSPILYSATKARAEELVRAANRRNFETVVVRPRLVWGRGDTGILPALVEAVASGRFVWIGGGGHRTSTTHVDNAVRGLLLAADRGRAGAAYFVSDGEPVVFRDFITDLLATQGVRPPDRNIPKPVAAATAAVAETLWSRLPLPGDPPLTRLAYWLSAMETTLDTSLAESELGYEPVISIEEGLDELREISSAAPIETAWEPEPAATPEPEPVAEPAPEPEATPEPEAEPATDPETADEPEKPELTAEPEPELELPPTEAHTIVEPDDEPN